VKSLPSILFQSSHNIFIKQNTIQNETGWTNNDPRASYYKGINGAGYIEQKKLLANGCREYKFQFILMSI
jgi:hypothetical protein